MLRASRALQELYLNSTPGLPYITIVVIFILAKVVFFF